MKTEMETFSMEQQSQVIDNKGIAQVDDINGPGRQVGDNDSNHCVVDSNDQPEVVADNDSDPVADNDSNPVVDNSDQPQPVADNHPNPVVDNNDRPQPALDKDLKPALGEPRVPNQCPEKKDIPASLRRHQAQCLICRSEHCGPLEELFLDWVSPDEIVRRTTNVNRYSIYRHAHAVGLFEKRRKNFSMALDRIIERVDSTPMNGSTILSAIKLLAKMESKKPATEEANPKKLLDRMSPAEREDGQKAEPVEETDFNQLFERMTKQERDVFFQKGSVPDWFSKALVATPRDGQEGEKARQVVPENTIQ